MSGIINAAFAANNTAIVLTTYCPMHNGQDVITVDTDAYVAYQNGAHIQDAFPEMPADQREQLMTGYCGPCFTKIATELEDDDV